MSYSNWRRLSKPLVLLVGGVLLSGCGSGDNIPLKKVDFVLDDPPKDYKEKRKEFSRTGPSSKIKGDPSGVGR